MARWRKVLARMAADPNPVSYTYAEASSILEHLKFKLAPHGGGSHRMWRGLDTEGKPVLIGLVEKGTGAMKPHLIRDMLAALNGAGLIPEDME